MTFVYINLAASAMNIISAGLLIYGSLKLREALRLNAETIKLLRAAQGIEAQRATTAKQGVVHESPVANGDAPQ